jgi:hypothetical protein
MPTVGLEPEGTDYEQIETYVQASKVIIMGHAVANLTALSCLLAQIRRRMIWLLISA